MQRILIALLALVTSPLCSAHLVDVFISGGPAFSNVRNQDSIQINDFVVNNYIASREWHAHGIYGLGASYSMDNLNLYSEDFKLALGMAGYFLDFSRVKGTEYPFVNVGSFDTLDYNFRAKSYSIMFEPRLIYKEYNFEPYVVLGVGASWNKFDSYIEVPSDPAGSAAPALSTFSSHTRVSFAYEAGAGVQGVFYKDCNTNTEYLAAADYRYVSFGKGELATSALQTTSTHLRVANLNAHTVMFSLKASFLV